VEVKPSKPMNQTVGVCSAEPQNDREKKGMSEDKEARLRKQHVVRRRKRYAVQQSVNRTNQKPVTNGATQRCYILLKGEEWRSVAERGRAMAMREVSIRCASAEETMPRVMPRMARRWRASLPFCHSCPRAATFGVVGGERQCTLSGVAGAFEMLRQTY